MILPYWVSSALMVLALAVMLGGNFVWRKNRGARLISQSIGLLIMMVGQLSNSLRSFEHTRLRLSDAVTTLSHAGISAQARSEAAGSAGNFLADLRDDAVSLGFGWALVGVAVGYLAIMIFQPAPSSDPTQPGTSA